jgi:DNA helicase-2/ATP-dependent DNA helicase PcrA
MDDCNWSDGNRSFRIGHRVVSGVQGWVEYPATAHFAGTPDQLGFVITQLIERKVVNDPSQIALLFYSVASDGLETIEALRRRGVECYAPRAGRFLDHPEVRYAVGALWALGGFGEDDDERPHEGPVAETCEWAAKCWHRLLRDSAARDLANWLRAQRERFDALERGEDMGASLLDLLYSSFRFKPFVTFLRDPFAARNLGRVSSLLKTFQQQLGFEVLHAGNRRLLPWRLWATFFYVLELLGVDDVERDETAPLGMVQVMTIHQAKGLEFPVVVIGSLARQARSQKEIDRVLGSLYKRGQFEPNNRRTEFDWRRMFYVAFSRAKHLLITYANGAPFRFFGNLVERLPKLEEIDLSVCASKIVTEPPGLTQEKPVLSLTGHVNVYRRCARQYEFFGEHGFAPSFAAQVFFGTVVHQTIEDIHRHVLDDRPEPLNDEIIDQFFQRNSELLRKRGIHPLAPSQREEARRHVQRYYEANRDTLDNVIDTEVEVVLEQPQYVLNGRVDLIRADDGALEMVDFKAQGRRENGPDFEQYRDQLALYSYLLEERYGQRPDRAILYFTGEEKLERARLVVDLSAERISGVLERFDATAHDIIEENFDLEKFPPQETCRACDFKHYCKRADENAKKH